MQMSWLRYAKWLMISIIIICMLPVVNYRLNSGIVTLAELGFPDYRKAINSACDGFGPGFYKSEFIAEKAAQDHFIYALASNSAYLGANENPGAGSFYLEQFPAAGYSLYSIALLSKLPTDLGLRVFINRQGNGPVHVIVAFRGTLRSNLMDWWSNFSWFTAIVPLPNHYASARIAMSEIVRELSTDPDVRARGISYVATGHSLGGGLAQHVAKGFPCVSAVVFDPSPVTNSYFFQMPFNQSRVVSLHQMGEPLDWVSALVGLPPTDSDTFRWYSPRLISCDPDDQRTIIACALKRHDMLFLSLGMARLVSDCQVNISSCSDGPPHVSLDPSIRDFYCTSLFGGRETEKAENELCADSWRREDNRKKTSS